MAFLDAESNNSRDINRMTQQSMKVSQFEIFDPLWKLFP